MNTRSKLNTVTAWSHMITCSPLAVILTFINLTLIQTLKVTGKPADLQSTHSFCPAERYILDITPEGRKDDARKKAGLLSREAGLGQGCTQIHNQ